MSNDELVANIERRAGKILNAAGQRTPPTDLERVLAYLRLHHERPWHLTADVWDSLSRPDRGRQRVKAQGRSLTSRGRWRVAHEVAHHVLHGAEPAARSGTWESHEFELEADLFAAALLMPRAALEAAVEGHDQIDLDELGRAFKVGAKEMEMRLRQLGLLRGEILGRM